MKTYAQNNQDNWILQETNYKQNGFFVDFGACDGILFSNTYLLETDYNWKGILCEPNKSYHEDLVKNRNNIIDFRCVYSSSKKLVNFLQVDSNNELSAIEEYAFIGDEHSERRRKNTQYMVETVSLNDLLKEYSAPKQIDYLSIDTEGSEYDILSNFDFGEYDIKFITVEHNWTPHRAKIYDLLTSIGYVRKYEHLSRWDDWYVKQ